MKNKNIYSVLCRIRCLLICLFMISACLILISCNSVQDPENSVENDASEDTVEYALALRVLDDINIGDNFVKDKLEIVRVRADILPAGAYSDAAELEGKYAISHICAGDFVTPEKISDTEPAPSIDGDDVEVPENEPIDPYEIGYVMITKYSSFADGEDYTAAIERAIEENPGRTIYFPDGQYIIKRPIVISTEAGKSVSLRLSNYAVIKAADWGDDKARAMIQIGCEDEAEPAIASADMMEELDFLEKSRVSIVGGCLHGSKLASGIAIGGGKDTYIYNVSIKHTFNGIHIKKAKNELGATYVNVDNVNIAGMDGDESVGVLVEGTYNTFSNMRIASVKYGVLCTETGSDNVFRHLHPLAIGFHYRYSIGFWDKSDGNTFDVCYSDQFAAGYRVEENTRSVFNGCFAYWYSEKNNYHVGYESTGTFNSIIVSGKVFHRHSVKLDAYLYLGAEGGQGVVLYPINSINSHIDMLKQHCKTNIIVYIV